MNRRARRTATVAAAAAAAGLVLAGCSSDDGTSAEDAVAGVTSAAESAVERATSAAESAVEGATGAENTEPGASVEETTTLPGAGGGEYIISGPILAKYNEIGGADSPLGAPTADQQDVGDGYVAEFEGGIVAWSPDTDAHVVWGEIRTAWEAQGGAGGELGFPISDERPIPNGLESEFEMGTITYVDGATQVIPK
ncbi:LGFP repeat-containing protein [Rhodococcus ruber]|uniref:LGFP repeat-containing protein n=1 Tax=Rhodococcus ruber TaxID=1830 RepID=UPI001122CFE3|nr:esterase [Rhodococcus ruber]QDC13728.1 esterase [Rhodococcus ruber]